MSQCKCYLVRTLLVALLVAMATPSLLRADVATPRPKWTKVQMESETVDITLGAKRVAVTAVFNMVNHGKSGKITMGYPLGLFEKKLNDFKVYVDGRALTGVRTQIGKGSSRPSPFARGKPGNEPYRFNGPYKEWKVFEVPMDANGKRIVKVTYWVSPAKVTDAKKGDLLYYSYTLKTGATWKGKIKEAVLRVKLDGVKAKDVVRAIPVGAVKSKDGNVLTWTMKDFKPTEDIGITYRDSRATKKVAGRMGTR